jgi:hypothetical protein
MLYAPQADRFAVSALIAECAVKGAASAGKKGKGSAFSLLYHDGILCRRHLVQIRNRL